MDKRQVFVANENGTCYGDRAFCIFDVFIADGDVFYSRKDLQVAL